MQVSQNLFFKLAIGSCANIEWSIVLVRTKTSMPRTATPNNSTIHPWHVGGGGGRETILGWLSWSRTQNYNERPKSHYIPTYSTFGFKLHMGELLNQPWVSSTFVPHFIVSDVGRSLRSWRRSSSLYVVPFFCSPLPLNRWPPLHHSPRRPQPRPRNL